MRRQNDAGLVLPVVHFRVELRENLCRIGLIRYPRGVRKKRPAPCSWIGGFP